MISQLTDHGDAVGGTAFAAFLVLGVVLSLVLMSARAEQLFALPASISDARPEDLAAFWRAGRMALEGAAAGAYDAQLFRSGLPAAQDGLLWLNPPHSFLAVAPFAALPYPAMKAVWLAATVLSLALCVRLTHAKPLLYVAILFSPAAFLSLLALQSGPMIAASLAAALLLAERRPLLAGVILAVLTMKPQYGLMAPIFLVAIGAWRAFAVAAAMSVLLIALSTAIFGSGAWLAFFNSVASGAIAEHALSIHRDMVTVHETVGKLGAGVGLRTAAQIFAVVVAGAAVYVAARRWRRDAAVGFALLASAFASPSLWVYDWTLVAAGLFMLTRAATPWPLPLQALAGALWFAPLISFVAATPAASLAAPAILTATLGGFWLRGERLRPAPSAPGVKVETGFARNGAPE